jgi:phage FluMu protein Com
MIRVRIIIQIIRKESCIVKEKGDDLMLIRCCLCQKVIADDILENMEVDCSTNLKHFIDNPPIYAVEIRCRRCKMFNTVYSVGGALDVDI